MSLEKTAKLIFKGDDQASHVMAALGGHLDDFGEKASSLNQSVADVTAPFANVAEAALKAELAIAASGAALVTLSVNQAGKFSDSFNEINTLFDTTDTNLASFKDSLLDYSRESSFAFEDINNAVYQAISFGADYADSLDVVNTAEKLAIGGKADLGASVELLSGTLNAYGADVSEAADYSDIFFTIVKDGKTTIPELSASLSKVTGVAAAAGIPMDDLGASLAAITASGAPTSEAVTGIKAAISNIIKPSKEASDTAAILGISFNATALESKGLDGTLRDVYDATGGNIEQMGKLFGSTEALNVALILGADSSGKFAGALADMETRAGATEAAYTKMADNISLINQNVINNARATLVEFGDPLLDGYRDIADGIVDIFKGISISIGDGAFDPVFDELNKQTAEAAEFLRKMAEALPAAMQGVDLDGLLDSFRDLGQSIGNLFDGVDLTSADGLKIAIQEVVDAVEGLTRFSSGIVAGAGQIIEMAVDWAQSFNDMSDSTKKSAGEMTGFLAAINQLTGPVGALFDAIGGLSSALNIFASASLVRAVTGLASLSGGFTGAAAAAGALVAPAALAAGAIAALGVGAYAIKDSYDSWQAAEDELQGSLQRGVEARDALAKKYEDISTATGVFIFDHADLVRELDAGTIALNKQTGEWEKVTTAEEKASEQLRLAADAGMEWSSTNRQLVDEFGNLYGTVDKATASIDKNRQATIDTAVEYYKLQGNTEEVARMMAVLEPNVSSVNDALKETETQTEATTLKLLDLASDERIRSMELSVDLKVANIEAETERINAMFSSIDNTVSETSDNIGTLYGLLDDAESFSTKWAIEDQLEKENQLRDQAAADAHEYNQLLIEKMELQNDNLKNGGSTITVQADGLKPHLELIFHELLKEIQVLMSESEDAFLLTQ